MGRFWGVLEEAFRGVFEVLLGERVPSRRKSVFQYANFPFKKPRKTKGFRSPEKNMKKILKNRLHRKPRFDILFTRCAT